MDATAVLQEASALWASEVSTATTFFAQIKEAAGPELCPTEPMINSLTMTLSTSSVVDVDGIRRLLDNTSVSKPEDESFVEFMGSKKGGRRSFGNQISLSYKEGGARGFKRNAKFFENGKIQVTGGRSPKDVVATVDLMLECLAGAGGKPYIVPQAPTLKSVQVQLINSDFRLNKAMDLDALKRVCTTVYGVHSRYDPDTHPAVIIKARGASIIVFKTGAVIITGGKSLQGVCEAYAFIVGVVKENLQVLDATAGPEAVLSKRPPRKSKRSFQELADGVEIARPAHLLKLVTQSTQPPK